MNLKQLLTIASNKENFTRLSDYLVFCNEFLKFKEGGLQAVIVSRNEQHYCFYQFKKDGSFNITRPINSHLMFGAADESLLKSRFLKTLKNAKEIKIDDEENRTIIRNSIYTIQQSIGTVLDALPAGKSNTARKINGDLFERLICLLIAELGIECHSGVVKIPLVVDGISAEASMSYQHDLIIRLQVEIKIIGSVKTSSKDRIDKIFIDKFLYNKLAEKAIPHIAVFLNDVQRKKTKRKDQYGINATFLPGHFKGYTVKLNPLDGVYYCDIRPNMKTDPFLRKHIQTIDHLFCRDIWTLLH
jgi:hypothetical protein